MTFDPSYAPCHVGLSQIKEITRKWQKGNHTQERTESRSLFTSVVAANYKRTRGVAASFTQKNRWMFQLNTAAAGTSGKQNGIVLIMEPCQVRCLFSTRANGKQTVLFVQGTETTRSGTAWSLRKDSIRGSNWRSRRKWWNGGCSSYTEALRASKCLCKRKKMHLQRCKDLKEVSLHHTFLLICSLLWVLRLHV